MAQCVRLPTLQEQLCCARREACTRYRDLRGPQGVTVPGTFRMSNVVTMEPSREARTGGWKPCFQCFETVKSLSFARQGGAHL